MVGDDYLVRVPSNVSNTIVTKERHLGHLICLKAWMFSCFGRYMIDRILVENFVSSPTHWQAEQV